MVEFVPLADHPHHQALVTDWLWQAFDRHNGREFFASIVQSSMRQEGLPLTFIALDEGQLVGNWWALWGCGFAICKAVRIFRPGWLRSTSMKNIGIRD